MAGTVVGKRRAILSVGSSVVAKLYLVAADDFEEELRRIGLDTESVAVVACGLLWV